MLRLLDEMITEPRRFRDREAWPLIWLDAASADPNLLRALARRYQNVTPTAWRDCSGVAGPDSTGSTHETASQERAFDPYGAIRLLRGLAQNLGTGKPPSGGRPLRRFDFVYWLAHQHLSDDGENARKELELRHRRYLAGHRTTLSIDGAMPTDSWWNVPVRLVVGILIRLGYRLLTRCLPHYRWLLRQPYLASPGRANDIPALALRAAAPDPSPNQLADLEKLLVHALLADLEARSPARWWPPRARRRARQPVLLFADNLTDTASADRLFWLIAAVRTETGAPDPVVVMARSGSVLPALPAPDVIPERPDSSEPGPAAGPTERGVSGTRRIRRAVRTVLSRIGGLIEARTPGEDPGHARQVQYPQPGTANEHRSGAEEEHAAAEKPGGSAGTSRPRPSYAPNPGHTVHLDDSDDHPDLLADWRNRHRRVDPAKRSWRLRVVLRPALTGPAAEQVIERLASRRLPRPAGAPRWASWAAVCAVLAVTIVGAAVWWFADVRERCGVLFPASDTRLVRAANGHCIGVTDLTDYTFRTQPNAAFGQNDGTEEHDNLRRAQVEIRKSNEQVEASGKPYVTVVYLGSIADRDAAGGTVAAPRAELEGLAIAQQNRIRDASEDQPLLRVLVANAGPSMAEVEKVAKLIDELYHSTLEDRPDPIVGVVGLGQSVRELEDAMLELQPTALPLVGSVTSYDELPDHSDNYFQVGPNNARAAQVGAYFARQQYPRARELLVVRSSAGNDTYSRNLAMDVRAAFERQYTTTGADFSTSEVTYETAESQEGLTMKELGREICEQQGLVFFAGRAQVLKDVAEHMEGCIRAGSQPPILAGDDVSRAVLEGALDNSGLELTYIPLATSATDDRGNCAKRSPPRWMSVYELNEKLFDGNCPDSSDGRMLLTYDAVEVLLTATDLVADTDEADDALSRVSGPAVRIKIEDIRGTDAINGVSGLIDFGRNRANQVPVNKAVSVLRIGDGDDEPELLLRCGPLYAGDTSYPQGCPR